LRNERVDHCTVREEDSLCMGLHVENRAGGVKVVDFSTRRQCVALHGHVLASWGWRVA
jgi:hypothetical protein